MSPATPPPAGADARPSLWARILAPFLRLFMKERLRRLTAGGSVEASVVQRQRARLDALVRLAGERSGGVTLEQREMAGVNVEVLTPPEPRAGLHLLYIHGGAFAMGSPRTHRGLTRRLAIAARARVIVPAYRLAPEHPYPAALTDLLDVYRELRAQGAAASRLVVAGESAGGNLVLALAQSLLASGEPQPAGLVLLSPWLDLAGTGESLVANRDLEMMVPVDAMPVAARMYAGDRDLSSPAVSPLYGEFRGLPPMLVHASSTEVLRDDAHRVVESARAAGVNAELRVWPALPHAFPAFADILPEARAAVVEIAVFVNRVVP